MRHNQNGRRFRGRNNSSGGGNGNSGGNGNGNGNGNVSGQSHHHSSGSSNHRRVNPRVQTFDSNGPDVRIRGNALQINEKYLTLARDAQGAGDRVLAESYLQHAEHYQRMLNEMTEEYNRQQAQFQPQGQPQGQPQHGHHHRGSQGQDDMNGDVAGAGEQPDVALDDLDQGFLVGRRNSTPAPARSSGEVNGNLNAAAPDDGVEDLGAAEAAAAPVEQARTRRVSGRVKETEAV
ncbi:MAG: DUF4167 domain-containing protein [Alphaproteobacteria bacterium]|nr:DUF4167 domain-containing protein [Alphaproteobacteria bacterium]